MQVTETKTITREIHVAPCLKCGGTDISLSDSNYSSFNSGGGSCKAKGCGNSAVAGVGCDPSVEVLAGIWNRANDISLLIAAEEVIVAKAQKRIDELKQLRLVRAGT